MKHKLMTLCVGILALLDGVHGAAAASIVHRVTPDSLDVPFKMRMECELRGTQRNFEIWAAIPPDRERVLTDLSVKDSSGYVVSVPAAFTPLNGGRHWRFTVGADALDGATFSIAFMAESMPSFDGWVFELGPLLRRSFSRAPFDPPEEESLESAPVDSMAAKAELRRQALRRDWEAVPKYTLVLGPS